MKKIIIVESPSKIKTINKFLGNDYLILSTVGHIRDLPPKEIGIKIEDCKVSIQYEDMEGKGKIIKELIKNTKDADEIFLATDPDREGEIISLHAKEIIEKGSKNKKVKIKRITFNEITKKAILESLKEPREIDENLVSAQQARRALDRLVGYKVSPILWKKVAKRLSAGRVQSIALKIICKREEEIKAFKIKEYWSIHSNLLIENHLLNADLYFIDSNKDFEIENEEKSKLILNDIKKKSFHIESIKDTNRTRKPYAPFITSTMQQAAYNVLGYNVQSTMMAAQNLYEGVSINENIVALITYMRTDSTRIANEAIKASRDYILEEFGKDYLPEEPILYSKQKGQDAHEAIRPIDVTVTPESIKPYVEKNLYKLYDLIWKRFVSCQMNNAKYINRQILFNSNDNKYIFKTSGSVITFDGFLKVYSNLEEDEEKGNMPPLIDKKSNVQVVEVSDKQHFTQPPARYSEATLIKELESKKIGRPSTYNSIMKTIRERFYTSLDDKKRFVPSELGVLVCNILEENITKIMDFDFTADLEEKLDEIASGNITRDDVLCDFYKYFSKAVELFEKVKINREVEETDIECDKEGCTGHFVVKRGKMGKFLGCSAFPECNNSKNFIKEEDGFIKIVEQKKEEALDLDCSECGKKLVKKNGRFGEFIACSGYPECKHIYKEITKNFCPGCNNNHLVKRLWKGNIFWSCQSYPKCKFGFSGDILEKECIECKYKFFKKSFKDNLLVCGNNDCQYKENI